MTRWPPITSRQVYGHSIVARAFAFVFLIGFGALIISFFLR